MGCGGSKPARTEHAGENVHSEQQHGEGNDREEGTSRMRKAMRFVGDGLHNVATGTGELGVSGKYGGVGPSSGNHAGGGDGGDGGGGGGGG